MIDFRQFREHVVIPALKWLDGEIPYSESAVDLLMMTAAHESKGGTFLRQVGMEGEEGAFGVYQMEIATHDDIYENYLDYDCYLRSLVLASTSLGVSYYRVPEALPFPPPMDQCIDMQHRDSLYLWDLAKYAKKYYNTEAGKATPEKYYQDYLAWRGW
jgi:hypothetical protein